MGWLKTTEMDALIALEAQVQTQGDSMTMYASHFLGKTPSLLLPSVWGLLTGRGVLRLMAALPQSLMTPSVSLFSRDILFSVFMSNFSSS